MVTLWRRREGDAAPRAATSGVVLACGAAMQNTPSDTWGLQCRGRWWQWSRRQRLSMPTRRRRDMPNAASSAAVDSCAVKGGFEINEPHTRFSLLTCPPPPASFYSLSCTAHHLSSLSSPQVFRTGPGQEREGQVGHRVLLQEAPLLDAELT